jgi:hypothetical protein
MLTPRRGYAARCISVPTADGRSSYTVELISGDRVALRVSKQSIFFTHEEARRVLTALAVLLRVEHQPFGRL